MSTTIALGFGGVAALTRFELPVPGSMAATVHGEFTGFIQHIPIGATTGWALLCTVSVATAAALCMGECKGIGDCRATATTAVDLCDGLRRKVPIQLFTQPCRRCSIKGLLLSKTAAQGEGKWHRINQHGGGCVPPIGCRIVNEKLTMANQRSRSTLGCMGGMRCLYLFVLKELAIQCRKTIVACTYAMPPQHSGSSIGGS